MEAEEKVKVFEKELDYIKDNNIRKFAEELVKRMPDYFFSVAASSTGRYHPNYSQGEGGLLRHTKAVVRIAVEMMNLEMFKFTKEEKDIIIISLILHDSQKHGLESNYGKFSVSTHPIIAGDWIVENEELSKDNNISADNLELIKQNVIHHMGEFVFDYKTNEQVLEKPKTRMQNFVFLSDYLASRKCLEFNFDAETIRK